MSFLTAFKTITNFCFLTCFIYIAIIGNFTKTITCGNELIPKARIAERNLLAQGHVKIIPFFPVRHNTLHFISLINFSSSPSARFYPTLVKTPRLVQYLKYVKLSLVKTIFPRFFTKKIGFLDNQNGECHIFESCFYSKLGNSIFFCCS